MINNHKDYDLIEDLRLSLEKGWLTDSKKKILRCLLDSSRNSNKESTVYAKFNEINKLYLQNFFLSVLVFRVFWAPNPRISCIFGPFLRCSRCSVRTPYRGNTVYEYII